MQSKRVKLIRRYLLKNDRVGKYLAEITKLYKVKPSHHALKSCLSKKLGAIEAFKYLFLLETLIYEEAVDLQLCSYVLQQLSFATKDIFDQTITQKYLNDYRLFLQKRCTVSLTKMERSVDQKNVFVFQLINLIKMVHSFEQVIYTFGRYYSQKCKFIIDFNIVLAKDILKIYNAMTQNLQIPHSPSILREIELAHEVMYPVFFNNYFYSFVSSVRPKWVTTDLLQTNKKGGSKLRDMDSTRDGSGIEAKSTKEQQKYDFEGLEIDEQEYIVGQFNEDQQQTKAQLAALQAELAQFQL